MSAPLPPLLLRGDCLVELARIPSGSVDSVVTDPPYGLEFMGKAWDSFKTGRSVKYAAGGSLDVEAIAAQSGKGGAGPSYVNRPAKRCALCGRQAWSGSPCVCEAPVWKIDNSPLEAFERWVSEWATECYRILKPGGHMLAFGGSRTWHRLAAGIEDAGFEIRDSIAWIYGSGFPKSMNPGCRCDPIDSEGEPEPKAQHSMSDLRDADVPAAEGSTRGAGAILQSSVPQPGAPERRAAPELDQVRGGEPSVEGRRHGKKAKGELSADGYRDLPAGPGDDAARERADTDSPARHGAMGQASADSGGVRESYRSRHDEQRAGEPRTLADEPGSQTRRSGTACPRCGKPMVEGLGTALKPAFEPVVVARKPLIGTVAANVLEHGTGALNIDATRIVHADAADLATSLAKNPGRSDAVTSGVYGAARPQQSVNEAGRWPANVALDESQAAALDEQTGVTKSTKGKKQTSSRAATQGATHGGTAGGFNYATQDAEVGFADSGGASRFFYVAKAPKSERPVVDGTAHPTVKPLALMRWLIRLVTPPGGVVVDPFAGSGTTLEAAYLEGFESIGVEMTPDYWPLIEARIERATR